MLNLVFCTGTSSIQYETHLCLLSIYLTVTATTCTYFYVYVHIDVVSKSL